MGNKPSNITLGDYDSLGFGSDELEKLGDVSFVKNSDGRIVLLMGEDKAVMEWVRREEDDFLSQVDRGLRRTNHYLKKVSHYDPNRESGAIISGTLCRDVSVPYEERPNLTLDDIAREIAESSVSKR